MAGDTFLRFGDAGESIDEGLEELSVSETPSISAKPRLLLINRLLCEVLGESKPRGVEVTFLGGCCKKRYVSRQADLGELTGVHSMLLNESGEPGYLSLRSESVPYPLSASIALVGLGRSDLGGPASKLGWVAGVRGLTATEDSRDCAW